VSKSIREVFGEGFHHSKGLLFESVPVDFVFLERCTTLVGVHSNLHELGIANSLWLIVPIQALLLFVSSDDGPAFLDEVAPAVFLIFACVDVLLWDFNVFIMFV
jgi:hypothetical protein